jgi:hypothetical protein
MRELIQRTFVLTMVGVAAAVSGPAFAQSATAAQSGGAGGEDQITVRGKALSRFRLELEEARDELIEVYNEENSGEDNDVICREERPTGSRMPQRVCRSNAQIKAEADASRAFLNALFNNVGSSRGNSSGAAKAAEGEAINKSRYSSAQIEQELEKLARENRVLYRAAVKYVEAEDAYNSAREDAAASRTAQ